MFRNTRFALAVHVLIALTIRNEAPVPSSDLAKSVGTHPTFLRQLMGKLRDAGLVRVKLGKGGGASLAKPAETITLVEVHRAAEADTQVRTHCSTPSAECLVGRNILGVLEPVIDDVEHAIQARLAQTTIADLARDVRALG